MSNGKQKEMGVSDMPDSEFEDHEEQASAFLGAVEQEEEFGQEDEVLVIERSRMKKRRFQEENV